jgi:putative copper export protein
MEIHKWLIVLHLIGATIWVGGHLILCLRVLPTTLIRKDPSIIATFENQFEPIGIPALLIQLITGILLALKYNLSFFSFSNNMEKVLSIKLLLLAIIVLLAFHARFYFIPKLNTNNLNSLAWHIVVVTLVSLLLLYFGVAFRYGI